jgi:hypothetical protein
MTFNLKLGECLLAASIGPKFDKPGGKTDLRPALSVGHKWRKTTLREQNKKLDALMESGLSSAHLGPWADR